MFNEIIQAYVENSEEEEVTEQEIVEALEESGLAELLEHRNFPIYDEED